MEKASGGRSELKQVSGITLMKAIGLRLILLPSKRKRQYVFIADLRMILRMKSVGIAVEICLRKKRFALNAAPSW